jgi:hypothetical protein
MMADDQISAYLFAAYPKKLQLDDGTALTIRPLVSQDRAQMGEFFERVTEEDRAFLEKDLLNSIVRGGRNLALRSRQRSRDGDGRGQRPYRPGGSQLEFSLAA